MERSITEEPMQTRWRPVGVALLILCLSGIASAQSPPGEAADPAAGSRLFQARCAACHGGDLAPLRQHRTFAALASAMWNHFPQMRDRIRLTSAPAPFFNAEEMGNLAAFLASTEPRAPGPGARPETPAGDPRRGEQVLASKGCLACHSISGTAGRRAGSLDSLKSFESPWSIVAAMWNHLFVMAPEAARQNIAWQQVSPEEMADLVAFLQALMRAR